MANHTIYYKILESPLPDPLPYTLPSTSLDAKDGFIHLSTAAQTPITADLFFSTFSKLWVLKVRVKDLDGEVRIPADLPGCPHLYDSVKGLGRENVQEIIEVEKAGYKDWSEVPLLNTLEG